MDHIICIQKIAIIKMKMKQEDYDRLYNAITLVCFGCGVYYILQFRH